MSALTPPPSPPMMNRIICALVDALEIKINSGEGLDIDDARFCLIGLKMVLENPSPPMMTDKLATEKRPGWVWVVIPSLVFKREEDAVGVGYYDSAAAYAAAEEMDESTVLRVTVA